MKKDARYTAAQALLRMESAGAYSNLTIDSLIEKNGLDAREGAFAAALFYTVLERRLTIDHVLADLPRCRSRCSRRCGSAYVSLSGWTAWTIMQPYLKAST